MAERNKFGANDPRPEDTGAGTRFGEIGTAMREKAEEAAGAAGNVVGQAKEKIKDWASTAGEKVGDAKSAVAGGMSSLADKIRERAPESGTMHGAAASVANNLESAGDYIRDASFSGVTEDIGNTIRRYPIQSMLVGLGLGFLLAQLTRRD